MSSHHIVREAQEPALWIVHATSADVEAIGQLLEWSPYTMLSSDFIPFAVGVGFKIDCIVCKEDERSILWPMIAHMEPLNWCTIPVHSSNPIEQVVEHLHGKGQKALHVFIGDFNTFLNSLDRYALLYSNAMQVHFFGTNYKATRMQKGFFTKLFKKGTMIQCISDIPDVPPLRVMKGALSSNGCFTLLPDADGWIAFEVVTCCWVVEVTAPVLIL